MNYRRLGRTGLEVSEVGYGAWGISGAQWIGAQDDESLRALARAIDLGLNFIDTALAYGEGHSEQLVGRWAAVRDGRALFSGGLRNLFSLADLKLERLLGSFDEWARGNAVEADLGPPERYPPTRVPVSPRWQLDLARGEIHTIVWATGFRPDYRWLDVPVVDPKGNLQHDGGAVDSPGMYALGLPVLRRRKSTFIHGIEDDAREVVDHLHNYLAGPR